LSAGRFGVGAARHNYILDSKFQRTFRFHAEQRFFFQESFYSSLSLLAQRIPQYCGIFYQEEVTHKKNIKKRKQLPAMQRLINKFNYQCLLLLTRWIVMESLSANAG
jgi:hypothetical protein